MITVMRVPTTAVAVESMVLARMIMPVVVPMMRLRLMSVLRTTSRPPTTVFKDISPISYCHIRRRWSAMDPADPDRADSYQPSDWVTLGGIPESLVT
jgi:hypothetical protein